MKEEDKISLAADFFRKAYKQHMSGNLVAAILNYRQSIDNFPTAKAHTFLGWALSLKGKYEEAIEECELAIDLEPDYGNPYNDIGTYLINLNRHEEAIYWFEKAIECQNYEPRHFPYYNLGRVYEKKGDWYTAIEYYKEALNLNSSYELARIAIIKLTALMN
jgi:tetratricopeptide (TPR) repeat protein